MIRPDFSCDFKVKKFSFPQGGHIPPRYLTTWNKNPEYYNLKIKMVKHI